MKVTTRDFAAAVRAAAHVIERRSTIPILEAVAIELQNDRVVARATDLDIELSVDLCEAPKKGAFVGALPGPLSLLKMMSGVAGSDFTMKLDAGNDNVRIQSEGFEGRIKPLPADDMPRVVHGAAGWSSELPTTVVDAILQVAGAMSTEETRYYLNGVLVKHLGDWAYRIAATDGHRLYYADVQLPDAPAMFPAKGAIIPRKAIYMLSRLRAKGSVRPVAIQVCATAATNDFTDWTATEASRAVLTFDTAGERTVRMSTKLIDGTFPDISRVIPSPDIATTAVTIATADLRRAVVALAQGSRLRTPPIKMTIDKVNGLTVGSVYADLGFDGRYDVAAEISGAPLIIGYNGNYVASILNSFNCERIRLLMTADSSPTMFVDPDGSDLRAVLMPMRV